MNEPGGLLDIFTDSVKRAPWGWGVLAAIAGTLIKVWPVLNDQILKVRESRRGDHRNDQAEWRAEMRQRMDKLETAAFEDRQKMEIATKTAQDMAFKLNTVVTAFQLLAGEIRKSDPENPVLTQATDLVKSAVDSDMGIGMYLNKLAVFTGSREGHA